MKKKVVAKLLAFMLCAVSVFSLLPTTVVSAQDGTSLLDMEDKKPENFDKEGADDPYGYGYGVPFLLSEESELMLMYTAEWGKTTVFQSYDTLKSQDGNTGSVTGSFKKVTNLNSSNGKYNSKPSDQSEPSPNTLSFTKTVAFDPTGSGRKDHVALVGVWKNKRVYIMVYDSINNRWSNYEELGAMDWMGTNSAFYQMQDFISITAGDYDGDNMDTVVVYGAFDHERSKGENQQAYGLIEVKVDNNNTVSLMNTTPFKNLLNEAYNNDADKILTSSDVDGDQRLSVDLATGDINKDGIDDLAILSYCNDIGTKRGSYNALYVTPFIGVSYGVKAAEGQRKTVLRKENGHYSKGYAEDGYSGSNDSTYTTIRAAGLTVADVDGNGTDDIIVAGKKVSIKLKGDNSKCMDSWSAENKLVIEKLCYNPSTKNFEKSFFNTSTDLNKFTQYTIYDSTDYTWPQLVVEGVYMNGRANPAYVFIQGDLYDLSTNVSMIYDNTYFDSHDMGAGASLTLSTNFISDAAVGNFDGNKCGYEQIVYVVGRKENLTDDYVFSLGMMGINNSKRDATTRIPSNISEAVYVTSDHESNYLIMDKGDDLADEALGINIVAMDNDNDGMLVKYKGKTYTYADPEVLVVLQAAPNFKALDDAGYYYDGFGTAYEIEETTSYSRGTSNAVSFGAGGTISMQGTIGGVDMQAGYAMDWSESFESTLSYTVKEGFAAQATDSVVIYRTPVFVYTYNYADENGNWDNNDIAIAVVNKPVYQLLSVDEYNQFVREYNQKMAAKTSNFTPMVEIDSQALYLGNAGNPYGYPVTGTGGITNYASGKVIGYEGGCTSSGYSYSTEEAHSEEMAHGFSFEMTVTFGFDGGFVEASAGAYVSLDYMKGTSTTYTEGKGVDIEGSVQNIWEDEMLADGYTRAQVRSYGFTWRLAQWDSNIPTGKLAANGAVQYVPVVGYTIDGLSSLPNPMEDVSVDPYDPDLDGDTDFLRIEWSDPNDGSDGYPKCTSYCIYLVTNGEKELVGTTTDLSFDFDNIDGRTTYEFIVTGVSVKDGNETLDSAPGYRFLDSYTVGIQKIELTSSDGLTDTYTIYYTNGRTQTFTVSNGNGIASITLSKSVDGVDTYTITFTDGSTQNFTVTNGKDGVGITNIEKTESNGNKDTYTITLGNGDTYTFTVVNGDNGINGEKGVGVKRTVLDHSEGLVDYYRIEYTDGSYDMFTVTNGKDGETVIKTEGGVSITDCKIDKDGNLMITLSDGKVINAGNVIAANNQSSKQGGGNAVPTLAVVIASASLVWNMANSYFIAKNKKKD